MPPPVGSGPYQQKILHCLGDEEMRTCREVAAKIGIGYDTARVVMRRLANKGLLRDTGKRGGTTQREIYWAITVSGLDAREAEDTTSKAEVRP
ncbi:hypothetical protein [Nocardia sp. N2S4-5]|uniref:hypothetical protein n=1 Tax=Nocardia sp. N2S4-5 TaxID=3351565 RepID=UPI0037D445AE